MVTRKRRQTHETKNGTVIKIILTETQHKLIKKGKVITFMVEGRYIRLHPPIDRIVARKIFKLQEQIKMLKKGTGRGTILKKENTENNSRIAVGSNGARIKNSR